ncbi:hypothetical protein HK098_004678 [Nowakowskiella sp. JEL0407]|nr:hypothetical protein HK098_004678 [Nowakowskiella sp. JEL0407]
MTSPASRISQLSAHLAANSSNSNPTLQLTSKLSGLVCILTGCNSLLGIGRAAAWKFAQDGASVLYVTDYDDSDLSSLASDIQKHFPNTTCVCRKLDASSESEVKDVINNAITKFGRLDVFFANAGTEDYLRVCYGQVFDFTSKGIANSNTIDNISAEDYMEIVRINSLSVFLAIKYAAMKITNSDKKVIGGSIIATASVAGLKSGAGSMDYSASKAAIISLCQTGAWSCTGTGIRINAICPGLIETGMTKGMYDSARKRGTTQKIGQLNPLQRGGHASEVANLAAFLASSESGYINGQAIPVDGGLSGMNSQARPNSSDFEPITSTIPNHTNVISNQIKAQPSNFPYSELSQDLLDQPYVQPDPTLLAKLNTPVPTEIYFLSPESETKFPPNYIIPSPPTIDKIFLEMFQRCVGCQLPSIRHIATSLECAMTVKHSMTSTPILNLLSDVTTFISSTSFGVPTTKKIGVFADYVTGVLTTTQIGVPIVVLALWLLERLRGKYSVSVKVGDGSEFRLFSTSLILANKVLDDHRFSSYQWECVTGIPSREINIMEMEFLKTLGYSVQIPFHSYAMYVQRIQQISKRLNHHASTPIYVFPKSNLSSPFDSPPFLSDACFQQPQSVGPVKKEKRFTGGENESHRRLMYPVAHDNINFGQWNKKLVQKGY